MIRVVSIFLLLVLLVSFVKGFFLDVQPIYVDFSCESALSIHKPLVADARMVYCVNLWPRNVLGGGTIYAEGSVVDQSFFLPGVDNVPSQMIHLSNGGIQINETFVEFNQTYKRSYYKIPDNPWLIYVDEVTLKASPPSGSNTFIYVTGDIVQRKIVSPIGILLLIFLIFTIARRPQRRRSRAAGAELADRAANAKGAALATPQAALKKAKNVPKV